CHCDQREYSCGHFKWLATEHCPEYRERQNKKCPPNITAFEDRTDICGECKPKTQFPWIAGFMGKT
ncbi:hypothetical protein B0H67DRAFT_482377, partial [Lasiosphaeris hirsuta]